MLSSLLHTVGMTFGFASILPGDIELHHTAPITRGDRPFFQHCESFLPVFLPFLQQGTQPERAKPGSTDDRAVVLTRASAKGPF